MSEDIDEEVYFLPEIEKGCLNDTICDLLQCAYSWQGEHHKLWFIEQIAARLGIELPERERGIPP